jgi:hypothetical protein
MEVPEMRSRLFVAVTGVVAVALFALVEVGAAQAPAPAPATRPAPAAAGRGGGAAPALRVHGTLNQVMRGILFPNSNVIFAAQSDDPAAVKPTDQSSTATDPLKGTYGGWQAVENSSLALAEAANLLTIPGRLCSNGKPVPMRNADWPMFVQGLRDAGMASYKAAQAKNQDAILEATDLVSTACANCHEVYRDKPSLENRCTK